MPSAQKPDNQVIKPQRIAIGVSGGHHSSSAIAVDLDTLSVVASVSHKPINIHRLGNEGHDESLIRISDLMNILAIRCGYGHQEILRDAADSWMFCLPGAWRAPDRAKALSTIAKAGWSAKGEYVTDDALAGLFVETCCARGICAFAGTGASVLAVSGSFDEQNVVKIDGWGPVIGDFGSSFQIVSSYFKSLRRTLDTGAECYLLKILAATEPALRMQENIQKWFDHHLVGGEPEWPVHFASLAKTICVQADQELDAGELPIATKVVLEAADQMAESIRLAYHRCKREAIDNKLVLQGGLFRNSAKYRNRVLKQISDLNLNSALAREAPVYGALMLALRHRPSLLESFHKSLQQEKTN
jgi:N-acetylglucosamine kinase-like BadF-type ATPase